MMKKLIIPLCLISTTVFASFDSLNSAAIIVVNADTITDPVVVTVTPVPTTTTIPLVTYIPTPTPTPTSEPVIVPENIDTEDYDKKMSEITVNLNNTVSYYNAYCRGDDWALDLAVKAYNSLQQNLQYLIINSDNMQGSIIDPESIELYQAKTSNEANVSELSLYLDYHANLLNNAKYYLQKTMIHYRNDKLTGNDNHAEAVDYYNLYQESIGEIVEECATYGNKF